MISDAYEWSTECYPPAVLDILEILFWCIQSIFDPLIYFWSNPSAFKVLKYKLRFISHLSSNETTKSPVGLTPDDSSSVNTPDPIAQ